jgi:transcription elongation GreA/GreB family factor
MLNEDHKIEIKSQVLVQLKAQQAILSQAVQIAAEATTHSEAKQEGKYDTRAIEASYLAGAQAERLAELDQKILTLERVVFASGPSNDIIKITSLVAVDDNGETKWFMLLPGAAGVSVSVASVEVTILSPESHLGSELIGKSVGEDVEITTGRVSKSLTIDSIL